MSLHWSGRGPGHLGRKSYPASAVAAPSDISFAVMDLATGTATGTVDYTSATITGLTPAATLLVGSHHAVASDPGETTTATMGFGVVQAAVDHAVVSRSSDNVASTTNRREQNNNRALNILSDSTTVKLATGTNISGGVQLDYLTADATDRRMTAMCFAGSNVQAKAGSIELGNGTTAITVSGVGFQPDVVILFGDNRALADGALASFALHFGFATSDGTQRCVAMFEAGAAAAGTPFQTLLTDCAGGNQAAGSVSKLTIGGFGADGFTLTPNVGQSNRDAAYLALKFTGGGVKITDLTTPTSTGDFTLTGAGFTPRAAIVVLTAIETVNTVEAATSDLQSGLSISFVGDEQWATAIRMDSGADPTDTASQCSNLAIMGPSATDCDAFKATLVGFTSDGATFNASAVHGTAKKGFILWLK